MRGIHFSQDVYAGLVVIILGIFTTSVGSTYSIGTVGSMGPGFMPTWLGIILLGIGGLLLVMGLLSSKEQLRAGWRLPDVRGSICIIGGLFAFIVLARYTGLVLASVAVVFISAMGDKTQTLKSAIVLTLIVTVVGIGGLSYGLGLPFPLFFWE